MVSIPDVPTSNKLTVGLEIGADYDRVDDRVDNGIIDELRQGNSEANHDGIR